MTDNVTLPPMSRRQLELLFLLVDNFSTGYAEPRIVEYKHFEQISESFSNKKNLQTAMQYTNAILKMYGFYALSVYNMGYTCHRSVLHTPGKFDQHFHGAKKVNEI